MKNPATALKESGISPIERGEQKINFTLLWIAIFKRTQESIVLKAMRVKTRGFMRKLQAKGLVKPVEAGTRSGIIWVLTPKGLDRVHDVYEKKHEYPERPERQSQTLLRHDLATQIVVAVIMSRNPSDDFYMPNSTGERGEWVPDAVIKLYGIRRYIEMERNIKYGLERLIKLSAIARVLIADPKINVHFVSHHETIREYQTTLLDGFKSVVYDEFAQDWLYDGEFLQVDTHQIVVTVNPKDLGLCV